MLRVLSRQDLTPVARLAWIMVVLVIPFAGVIIYFLFGEANLGHADNIRHKEIFDEIRLLNTPALGQLEKLDGGSKKNTNRHFNMQPQ